MFIINRRRFLQIGAAGAATFGWTLRAYPFALSLTGIGKFFHGLPGLTPDGKNDLGNFIPVLSPTRVSVNGTPTDAYLVKAVSFKQRVHSAIPTTTFFGYAADTAQSDEKYLGGVIVATRGTPVRLRARNLLPVPHILPDDETLIDAAVAAESAGRTDRITVHLHGGLVFWHVDGGPFTWFSNPANGGFVRGSSFINPGGIDGTAIYDYPNDQSARTIWYHDHAYGLTRTNVYAGLASAYLITDPAETALVGDGVHGVIPSPPLAGAGGVLVPYPLGIPLIVQDKTFWDGSPTGSDPGYATAAPGAVAGSLWYPHVYEGALDADLPSMLYSDLPANPPNTTRWGADPVGAAPTISTVPEFFSDTILVNGAPYPTVSVPPRRFRFRFVNAANARFFNLHLYVANGSPDGITLAPFASGGVDNNGNPILPLDNNGNPILAPTNAPGPAFIQIGNEAGFLPAPAIFSTAQDGTINLNSNRPMGYKAGPQGFAARRADAGREATIAGHEVRMAPSPNDPTIGNAVRYNLLMAPAERPDVIIDFRGFEGRKLILYNDAPAPFPGGDIRNDYFVGSPDLTSIGGAPPTTPGFGPDTRILMRFEVAGMATIRVDTGTATTTAAGWDPNTVGIPFTLPNVDLTSATNPAPLVVYQTGASGSGDLIFPLVYTFTGLTPNLEYTVRLHFADVAIVTAGQRVFNVSINGVVVLPNFDIVALAGGALKAHSVDVTGTTNAAGALIIRLAAAPGTTYAPIINGIELLPIGTGSNGSVDEPSFTDTVNMLNTQLHELFEATYPTDIVPTVTYIKTLLEDNDVPYGRLRQLIGDETGTAKTYLDPLTPGDMANVGQVQQWQIFNLTADTHPMHFHLVNVRIRNRAQWVFDPATGLPASPLQADETTSRPPDANEMGWKETVRVNPGELVTVDMKFDLPTGTPPPNSPRLAAMTPPINGAEYVWHCHILEHEEHDMMRPMVVLMPTAASGSAASDSQGSNSQESNSQESNSQESDSQGSDSQ